MVCAVTISHGIADANGMRYMLLMCVVSPFLQMIPASHGSQLPLLVAVVELDGLDEIC